jgi:hypothetical protein
MIKRPRLLPVIRRCVIATLTSVAVMAVASRINRTGDEAAVEAVLQRRVPSVTLDMYRLDDALSGLSRASGVTIRKDDEDVLALARGSGHPLRLNDVTVGEALAAIINRFDRDHYWLTYKVEGDNIVMGRMSKMEEPVVVRAYDVADLLAIPELKQRKGLAEDELLGGNLFGGSGGGGGGLFGGGGGGFIGIPSGQWGRGDRLIVLIQEIVTPTVWDGRSWHGGMRLWDEYLVVTAPKLVHRDIERLLFLMRNPAGPQSRKATP